MVHVVHSPGAPIVPRSGKQRVVMTVLAACLMLHGQRALAAPTDREHEAGVHFDRGVELYREGSLDAALVEFERAYEIVPNFRLLFNLGQIQAERHDYTAALRFFEQYLKDGGEEIPESRRAETQSEIERLRARVAYLWVESNVAGATLSVNGVSRGTLPLRDRIGINPGLCELRLEKPGFVPAEKQLKVAGGELPRVQMSLTPVPVSGSASGADMEAGMVAGPGPNYLPFWITSATAVAFGGATLGLGLAARNAHRELDSELNRFPGDQGAIDDARGQLKLYSALSATTGAIGLLALGVAIYLVAAPPHARARAGQLARGKFRILPGSHSLSVQADF